MVGEGAGRQVGAIEIDVDVPVGVGRGEAEKAESVALGAAGGVGEGGEQRPVVLLLDGELERRSVEIEGHHPVVHGV